MRENDGGSNSPKPIIRRAVEIGLWCFLCVLPLRLQFGTADFIGIDSPFHARYASQFGANMLSRTFPATAYSLWARQWGDKEFLFHAYLAPFCLNESFLRMGAKLASAILFAGILVSFAVILKRQKIPGALLWAALLPGLSVGWDYRMLMVRSHVASVLLLLWILCLFEQRKLRLLLILVFAYAWTYTAPYFALVMCAFMAMGRLLSARVRATGLPVDKSIDSPGNPCAVSTGNASTGPPDRRLLLGCTVATIAGLVIHPQTPNQILNDWLHLSLVASRAWGLSPSPVELGAEFQSETLREAYSLHPGVLLCLVAVWLLVLLVPGVYRRRTSLFIFMTLPAVALYGLSGRFIEYLAPLTVWAAAHAWTDARPTIVQAARGAMPWGRRLVPVLGLAIVVGLYAYTFNKVDRLVWHPVNRVSQEQAGRWLAASGRPGDLVVPLDWTQFPELYYYAPKLRYVVGLEPTTMEVLFPEKLHYLEDVRLGKRDLDMTEMREEFPDARYVVIWKESAGAASRIAHKNFVPLYADANALILDARADAAR